MFDSQVLSFDNFITGYKHGVYILTKDSCGVCQDYKKDIEYVNNRYLYFVDITTKQQEAFAKKLHNRLSFPMTAGWKDNQLVFVRLGELFGDDFNEVLEWLKQFGDAPLTQEELKDRIEKYNAKCTLSFYIFPDDIKPEEKDKIIATAYDRHELPVDIDTICPSLEISKRVNMILSYIATANYILWNTTGTFSPFKTAILKDYFEMKGRPVEVREIDG